MAGLKFFHIVLLALSYVVIKVISSFLAERRFKAFAEQHGCKAPLNLTPSRLDAFVRLRRLL